MDKTAKLAGLALAGPFILLIAVVCFLFGVGDAPEEAGSDPIPGSKPEPGEHPGPTATKKKRKAMSPEVKAKLRDKRKTTAKPQPQGGAA